MKKTIITLFLLLSIQFINVSAQTKGAIISGNIGTDETGYPVELMLLESYKLEGPVDKPSIIKAKTEEGHFQLNIPIDKPAYFQLTVFTGNGKIKMPENLSAEVTDFLYLLEPGDSVHLEITLDKSMNYTGIGCEKFLYRQELSKEITNYKKTYNFDQSDTSKAGKTNYALRYLNGLAEKEKDVLARYKTTLPVLTYTLLNADIDGLRAHEICRRAIFSCYYRDKSGARKWKSDAIAQQLFREQLLPLILNNSPRLDTLLLSRGYWLMQIWLPGIFYGFAIAEKFSDRVLDNLVDGKGDTYKFISAAYDHEAREKLLCYYFVYRMALGYMTPEINIYLQQYMSEPVDNLFRSRVKEMYEKSQQNMARGMKVAPFKWTDPNGKQVSLTDFKGKVVLLDFWYTGCKPCKAMAPYMEKIKEKYKNNKNVVFVNISIDPDKNIWKKSIPVYAPGPGVSLYTNGKGDQDPWLQQYPVGGYPRLMLIDQNGLFFNSQLPKPDGDNGAAIINTINYLLGKK